MSVDSGRRCHLVVVVLTVVVLGTFAGCAQDPTPTNPAYIRVEATANPPSDATVIDYNQSSLDADPLEHGFDDVGTSGVTLRHPSDETWYSIRDQFHELSTLSNKSSGFYYLRYKNTTYEVGFIVHG